MIFDRFWHRILAAAENVGRARARQELLSLGDRTLADAGISRELLEEGVRAWPWRAPVDTHEPWQLEALRSRPDDAPAPLAEAALDDTAAELRAYSDAELRDLEIVRGEIDAVVRSGRPGIDDQPRHAA